ncbi:uncharacterized protein BX663DRAFT_507611 [Cokeromyces recurvatus]|uniref:uncharacterized protein n=1 Tax=Cokeromyces recurvatus TaxID=90255 RepID=UPI00221E51B4|nr:uncharacterized protein BX663DRAFT_507611 [Cokeromyces recurvatus]KAI7903144.1 hypothetical protein BX663DRAFT_507611 [Cokeromyces recurvatus]
MPVRIAAESNTNASSEPLLRLGDELFFFDENNNVLTAENPLQTNVCVRSNHPSFLSSTDALGASIFRIEPQQAHSAQKELKAFIGDDDVESFTCEATIEELEQFKLLRQKATKEIAQNEAEKRRLLGKPILYGQVIQLYNRHFKKYLTVTGKTGYKNKQNRLQVNLSSEFVGYFRIMPRYRIRFVGDVIRIGETIALQCVRPEGYLNVDYTNNHNNNSMSLEVYSHTRISSWTIRLHYSPASNHDTKHVKYTNSGQYVRFYHKEMESYLEASLLNGNDIVILKKHIINPLDPKETDSPQAFWEIENVDVTRGSRIRWEKSIRIRHVATRAYLAIESSSVQIDVATGKTTFTLKLVKNPSQPMDLSQDDTLFQLVPISAPSVSGIPYGSFVRIKHLMTGCWIHATNSEQIKSSASTFCTPSFNFSSPIVTSFPHNDLLPANTKNHMLTVSAVQRFKKREGYSSMSPLSLNIMTNDQENSDHPDLVTANHHNLNYDATLYGITATQDFHYHDCFSITLVDEELANTFNFANEMIPQLQLYLCQDRPFINETSVCYPFYDEEYEWITDILKALIRFCTKSNETDIFKRVGLPIEYHQTLLRDIGIIDLVIDMIIVPFDLDKRKTVRDKLRSYHPHFQQNKLLNSSSKSKMKEKEVTKSELLLNTKLRNVLALCYNLLRVFLIQKSTYEMTHDDSIIHESGKLNQLHIFNKAGERGIALFLEHLSYNIGATDMMIKLLELTAEQNNLITIPIVENIIENALLRTEEVVNGLKNDLFIPELQQQTAYIQLLSVICQKALLSPVLIKTSKDSKSLVGIYRDTVTRKLFNSKDNSCLFMTRLVEQQQKNVEVKLINDEWRDLDTLLIKQPNILFFIECVIDLVYSLSNEAHAKVNEFFRRCFTKEVCFKCIKNKKIPSTLRSKFCDLLRVLYINIHHFKKVALSDFTIYTKAITTNNPTDFHLFSSNEIESDFFQSLKNWTLRFLSTMEIEFTDKIHEIQLLSSILALVHTQLLHGFFQRSRDIAILFRTLVRILDGRTDARNEEHHKYLTSKEIRKEWHERYTLTEKNQHVMNTKIQILRIFNLIFDLRLRVRMLKLGSIWKEITENPFSDYHTSPNASGLSCMLSVFEETGPRDREESLMPILKDILKYEYAPLKEIAIIVMHRLFTESQELFEKLTSVVVLSNPDQLEVYHSIEDQVLLLQALAYADNFDDEQSMKYCEEIRDIISTLQFLLKVPLNEDGKTTKYDSSIYCRIFKSMNACDLLIVILKFLMNILPSKHYTIFIDTMNICLQLLHTVTKYDKEFQSQFVLSNMDLLISVTELSPKLAITFAQLCSNNLQLSSHVKEGHIIRIIELSRKHQGEYLLVLHDFLKTQGMFIKNNQDIVMRFIMDHRQEYVPFDSVTRLKAMHKSSYCINLISILAICGQGENTFGQSFARTIFSIQDIYNVVHDEHICIGLKSVMLKFLASIYIEDIELTLEDPIHDNENILQLITISEEAISKCLDSSIIKHDMDFYNYVFRGVLAFLRGVFDFHISVEVAANEIPRYSRLVDNIVKLLPFAYDDEKALQVALACLDSMINVAGFRGYMNPVKLYDTLKEAAAKLDTLYVRNYHYHHENHTTTCTSSNDGLLAPIQDPINASFQDLFNNIKSSSAVEQYQQQEFKTLCAHFHLSQGNDDKNENVKSLISYLSTMTTTKIDKGVEHYQVATINLLEEIARKYIRAVSRVDPNSNPSLFEKLENKKMMAQNTLNDLGSTLIAQNLLSSPRRRIFDAALKLLIALLDGGNKNVQDKLEEYFYSIREERFFYSFHQRLQSGINSSKDSQIYLTRRMYKMDRQQQHMLDHVGQQQQESVTSIAHKRSNSIGFVDTFSYNHIGTKRNSHHLKTRKRASSTLKSQYQLQALSKETNEVYQEISHLMLTKIETVPELGSTMKDYKVMQDTMRTLQLMVEGHNLHLQTYLAKQPDNIKSFNIVLDVVEYFHAIVPLCNQRNIELIIQVLDTITELAQGCLKNQVTIFNNKIINPMNIILKENYNDCDPVKVNELKSKVLTCLLSLLEGGIENSETIFKEMVDSLDLVVIRDNMETIYKENLGNLKSKNLNERLECGFLYCILIMTLAPALHHEQDALLFENNEAFNYFQSHTGKIEIIMDYGQKKQLTRVLFRIPEICQYLREETKQRFLWTVKRESPSSKIEDFVQQSGMIIYEIENQAHVAHSKYLSFLTEYSSFWWESAYGVTILLNMLLMMYPALLDLSIHNNSNHPSLMVITCWYLLGFVHIGLWLLLTAEFYFIQLPILINRHHGSTTFFWATLSESRFLYHVLMVTFSAIGFIYPSFYSIHLLDFVFRDSILQGVISSITLNIHSISRTALLGIIVVYIHSIIAYMYFRKQFDDTKGLFCGSLVECFITVLSHGVRSGGGIGDILEPSELHKPSGWRTVFEMSFYLVVVVFLLNAIFGIIFDTFGHLRDERSSIQQDMKNSCFICSIPAVEFQRHAKKGFEEHVKNDHNIWQYLFFLVHLKYKDRTEYTGPESYVATCLKNADYNFFPINRALGLSNVEQDDKEKLDKLEKLNHLLLDKLAKLEERITKITDHQAPSRKNSLLLSPM